MQLPIQNSRRSVCEITPGHLSTNPRLVKEADALQAAGFDVSVVAADYLDWAREADLEFGSRGWRVASTVRFGPLAPLPLRMRQKLLQGASRAIVKAGFSQQRVIDTAWHPVTPELIRAASATKADLYIAHYPAALPAAALAARKHGTLYAFDAEDYHLGDPPEDSTYDFERAMIRAIEGQYLPGAAYVTAASPGIAEAYAKTYGIDRPTVVLNVFPAADGPAFPSTCGTAKPSPSLYWFSQTIGPDRGLECAVEAIARARSAPHLYLRGLAAPGFDDRLKDLARQSGIEDRLHILPIARPAEMTRLAAAYDLGLVSETGYTPNRRIALTNKQFTYLLAGVPAVASDLPAHRRLARGLDSAVLLYSTGNASSLSEVLDGLLLNPARLAAARAAAFELGQKRFNWENESRIFVNLVQKTLSDRQDIKSISSLPPPIEAEVPCALH
jgi:glycosyltransferase involved in cell wall biosynthesis